MKVSIKPSLARGKVAAPPSKSMAHRLLICAGLSSGESIIHGISLSEDILATLDCLSALGAEFTYENETVFMHGTDLTKPLSPAVLPCRECGSTLRFFIPLCLLTNTQMTLTGSEKLLSRPLTVYETLCRDRGIKYVKEQSSLAVCGKLSSGEYELPGDVSSQFVSGLLFALPLLDSDSKIRLIPPVESRPYIDMTVQALSEFGISAVWEGGETLLIRGNQHYAAAEAFVEGDYSNAAFFEALNTIGGDVELTGLRSDTLQGDRIYIRHFRSLSEGYTSIDISDCPDLGPILFAVAAMHKGGEFTGTRRLKIKESDRGAVMAAELSKFGVNTEVYEDRIIVHPAKLHSPKAELDGHNDHRIVMALATMATKTGGTITGAQAVRKSLPDYFERLKTLGIEVSEVGMDK